MAYTNSPLVSYTKLSPNCTKPRNHTIDTITPHCVVGQLSAKATLNLEHFVNYDPNSGASCNYAIGTSGEIGMGAEEGSRSWCTSNRENDHRAITIECASDAKHPYAMNTAVYTALVNLCVDICKRNGKKKLLWLGDKATTLAYTPKSDEMVLTAHRWFANKACPGDWLYNRLGDLATEVTAKIGSATVTTTQKDGTYVKGSKTKLSTNFTANEFDCNGSGCCTETVIDPKLVDILQKIRSHFGKAVTITSGYRCPTHNSKVSKSAKSLHTTGQAADITVKGITPREVAQYAESIGIKGIGLYETDKDGHFVHVDTRTTKAFWYGQDEAPMTTFKTTTSNNTAPTPTTVTNADKVIWDALKGKGLNAFAIAGIMGNLYAESALKPTNLQNTYEKSLGYTDDAYTAAVDNGSYTNFVKDSAGYGLAQWTYWSRKQNLLNYAKSVGKSIGDLNMQIEFLWNELQGYKTVMTVLKSAKSIKEASDIVLTEFERPANTGDSVKTARASYGQKYYDKFASASDVVVTEPAKPDTDKTENITPTKEQKATDYAQNFNDNFKGKYKVTAKGGLNLRHGAGMNKAILCAMPYGTVVQNFGYYTNYSGVSWLYVVATVNGVRYTGFCSKAYLAKT